MKVKKARRPQPLRVGEVELDFRFNDIKVNGVRLTATQSLKVARWLERAAAARYRYLIYDRV